MFDFGVHSYLKDGASTAARDGTFFVKNDI